MRSSHLPLIPSLIQTGPHSQTKEAAALFAGIALLAILAQISIHLPWSPVPITGQTFGVALIGLTWGSKRGFAVALSYLVAGFCGLPIFAQGTAGHLGATSGYLLGMLVSVFIIGYCSEQGFTRTLPKTMFVLTIGSLVTFTFGLLVLSHFLPSQNILMAGLLPFIPGDIIKNILAASIVLGGESFRPRI